MEFPASFPHQHPPVRNVNQVFEEQLTRGDRTADRFAAVMGSWSFIIAQSCILVAWVVLNVLAWIHHWIRTPSSSSTWRFRSRRRTRRRSS